jgi:hypothetical protein
VTYRPEVDIGTFTGIVLLDERGGIRARKRLSSPPDDSEANETGIAKDVHQNKIHRSGAPAVARLPGGCTNQATMPTLRKATR